PEAGAHFEGRFGFCRARRITSRRGAADAAARRIQIWIEVFRFAWGVAATTLVDGVGLGIGDRLAGVIVFAATVAVTCRDGVGHGVLGVFTVMRRTGRLDVVLI